jgi:hypothetical protein
MANFRIWPRSAAAWSGCPVLGRTAAVVVVWLILTGFAVAIAYGVIGIFQL